MNERHWPALFKMGSSGKEQIWKIGVAEDDAGGGATICTMHGHVDGKIQTAIVRVKTGKNLGRSNATTAYEQSQSEAQAKWLKQQDKGYSEERGGASMDAKPMLAHKYEDDKDKVDFCNAFIQPKLDGIRCLAHMVSENEIKLISRGNKPFAGLDHIRRELLGLMKVGEIWDGELFKHGMTFQVITSLVKKQQPASADIEYHVYDMIKDTPFNDRSFFIEMAFIRPGQAKPTHVIPVETAFCGDHDDVEREHEIFVSNGYEGAMLRWGNEPYKAGYRSHHLLKVKAFMDDEFRIVDVVEGKGKFTGRAIFVCETGEGVRFEAVPKGRDELRKQYFEQRSSLIGKYLTVKFFEWTTSEKRAPRFPVALRVREEES